jgi:hypothetical protein
MRVIDHFVILATVGTSPTLDCHPLGAYGALITVSAAAPGSLPQVTDSGPSVSPARMLMKTAHDLMMGIVPYNYILTPIIGGILTFNGGIVGPATFDVQLLDEPPAPQGTWLIADTLDVLIAGAHKTYNLIFGAATDFTLTVGCSNGANVTFDHGGQSEHSYASVPALVLPAGNNAGGFYEDHVYTQYADYFMSNPDPINPTTITTKLRARIHSL